ncbi:hypothetical protein FY528_11860 [Hymenobacter lutimineralis]|uniref:DUF3300 domain-containing protein n=1 Tax=Hymenobacter lutimineralis TaxID=2606448 RepID=A0A5D6V2U9_9BACT|nr:hypothetical protein [Hymenobacter lutimineralis]TYZ08904.1 hypothetical protein FY528_11860 [Hymenobacter lutimineralis]
MKTLLKSGLLLALALLLHGTRAQAQVHIDMSAPYWGPSVGPDVQYYYIPEIDGYYDLYNELYLVFDPVYGAWVSSPYLPRAYAAYDPRFFHPVVIQYVGRRPWGYHREHRAYCDRWGVRPGRYYGARWPGRNYVAYPQDRYEPGYYASRPQNQGGYTRNDNRYSQENRGTYGSRSDNRREERADEGRNGSRSENRGGYAQPNPYERGTSRGSYSAPERPQNSGGPGRPTSPNSHGEGRGRGRM